MSRGSGLCPSWSWLYGKVACNLINCLALLFAVLSGSWLPSSNCIAGIIDGSALLLTVVLLVTKQSSAMKFFVSSIGPANWPHSSWWTYYNAEGECIQLWYSLIYNSLACFLRFDAYTTNPNWFDAKREDKIMCLVPLVVGVFFFDCPFIRARCRRPFITVEKPLFWKSR